MEVDQEENTQLALAGEASVISTEQESGHPAIRAMNKLPFAKQMGLILGLAFSIAIGVAVVLWSQSPDYSLLFASVADKDVGEVLDALEKLEVDYRVESTTGAILVTSDDINKVRMKLAGQGLPRSDGLGFEILEKESGFGVSQIVEKARYKRALEGEITRSITSIQSVKAARVILALPKQSVFIRNRKKPSASVIIDLYRGRILDKVQIQSIVHLVASAVPLLEAGQVTVVDQRGRLLNDPSSNPEMELTSKQFDYKKRLENHLMERVENIIAPLVGGESIRTQVTADVDFTITERTQERFNPDLPALRSEHTIDEQNRMDGAQGVPGALSNQPPAAGTAPEVATGEGGSENGDSAINLSKSATRNYELDKTISHIRQSTGDLRRLSVAVVIDHMRIRQEEGGIKEQPYSEEDIVRFTDLVKQAIGYDANRGDRVTVTNVAFRVPEPIEPLPALPIWEQPWFAGVVKQVLAALVVVFLIVGVLRPAMRGLVAREIVEQEESNGERGKGEGEGSERDNELEDDLLTLGPNGEMLLLEGPLSYEKQLEFAQKMADEDPKRVVQVIKSWMGTDGGR